jgi:RNase P subunit RPR2
MTASHLTRKQRTDSPRILSSYTCPECDAYNKTVRAIVQNGSLTVRCKTCGFVERIKSEFGVNDPDESDDPLLCKYCCRSIDINERRCAARDDWRVP